LSYLKINDLIEEENGRYIATEFGKNISFLYISTLTGIHYKTILEYYRTHKDDISSNENLVLLSAILSNDFKPKISLRRADMKSFDIFESEIESSFGPLFGNVFTFSQFNEVGRSFMAVREWLNEKTENEIYEKFSVEPGDLYRQVESIEWLVHAFSRISLLLGLRELQMVASELEERIRYGVKKELLELTQLEGIGRVRARLLYSNGLKTINDLRRVKESDLSRIPKLGPIIAKRIKDQVSKYRQ
jgi:helicase